MGLLAGLDRGGRGDLAVVQVVAVGCRGVRLVGRYPVRAGAGTSEPAPRHVDLFEHRLEPGLFTAEIGAAVRVSRRQARAGVFRFIEVEYNRRLRRHPEYGFPTPLETRARTRTDLTLAA